MAAQLMVGVNIVFSKYVLATIPLLVLLALGFAIAPGLHIILTEWLILIVLGLSARLFFVFWNFGSQRVDGLMASLSTAVMPVSTVIIAWMVLGEQLTMWQMTGISLVILSIFAYAKH